MCLPGPVSTLGSLAGAFQNVLRGQFSSWSTRCASAYTFQGARVPQRFGGSQMFQMSVKFFSMVFEAAGRGPDGCGQQHWGSAAGCAKTLPGNASRRGRRCGELGQQELVRRSQPSRRGVANKLRNFAGPIPTRHRLLGVSGQNVCTRWPWLSLFTWVVGACTCFESMWSDGSIESTQVWCMCSEACEERDHQFGPDEMAV